MFTKEQMKHHIIEWILERKEQEENEKVHPAWKKLRPNKDDMNYRLPGNFK